MYYYYWLDVILAANHEKWEYAVRCCCEENSLVAQLRIDFVLKLCYLIHNCMLNTLYWDIRANFVP